MAYTEDVNVNLNVLAGAMGGITAIMGGMSALTSTFGQFGTEATRSFGTVDGILVSATALIASFGIQASEAFGEFEQGMKIVQAVSGQSNAAISQLTNAANEMSIAYRTSIGDITEGLQTLGRAGLNSASEQLEVLESGLQTAKLEGRNLNGVLEELIQNTAMLGGDLKSVDFGDQTSYVNSLMVGTSMSAPIDTHDVSQTLQYAGGTAAAAGANLQDKEKLEDLMGTIAAFAQKGVTGSMAGTALRAFFTKPASQDKTVTEGLGMLGLSPYQLWENGGESMKDVSDQIGIIQRQMDRLNLSTMDQVEIWGKIVGPKMGQQMMKLESGDIKELTRDIQSAQSAEELATQTLQTYTQKISEMKQQGELAYREFGEKAARFLLPVVEVITKILGMLSTPLGSFATFGVIGSIVIRGVRAAWNMISVAFNQFRSMIADVRMGIQSINSISGDSASGFGQSASQVDFLNSKLRETNAEMQQLQAQSLGIRPGYIMPGALPTDKVQRGTFKAYEEDVIKDEAGVLGRQGQYFSGDRKDAYEQGIDEWAQELEDSKEAAKTSLEEQISNKKADIKNLSGMREEEFFGRLEIEEEQLKSALEAKVTEATEMHNQAIQRIENLRRDVQSNTKGLKIWDRTGIPIDVQKEAFNDPNVEFASQFGRDSPEYKKAIQQYLDKSSLSHLTPKDLDSGFDAMIEAENKALEDEIKGLNEQYEKDLSNAKVDLRNQTVKEYSGEMSELSNELKELEAIDIDESYTTMSKNDISKLKKDGVQKVRTELRLLDEAEYAVWEDRMKQSGELGQYSLARTNEFYDKESKLNQYYGKELEKLEKQGYRIVAESHAVPDSHPNVEVLGQALNNNIPQDMAKVRDDYIKRQQALFSGKEMTQSTSRLGAFSSALDGAKNSASSFKDSFNKARERFGRSSDFIVQDGNASLYQNKLGNLLSDKDFVKNNIQGQETGVAMTNLRNELNLTAQEFALLISSTSELTQIGRFTAEEAKALGNEALSLREKLALLLAQENEEAAVSAEVVAAKRNEVNASRMAAASDMEEAGAGMMASLKSGISSVVNYMGGPLMAGMMAITAAMELYNSALQGWQEQVQESQERMATAKDQLSTAEEEIRNIYSSEFNDMSEADMAKIIDYQYAAIQQSYNEDLSKHGKKTPAKFSDMYNNEVIKVQQMEWTDEEKEANHVKTAEELAALNENAEALTLTDEEHIKQLEDNTAALNSATYAYSQALAKEAGSFNDPMFGYQGIQTKRERDSIFDGALALISYGGIGDTIAAFQNQNPDKGFFDLNTPVLTEYQKSKDFMGSTEFAPAMMLQIGESGVDGGLRQFFGNDYQETLGLIRTIANRHGQEVDYFSTLTNNGFQGMDANAMSMAQMAMKEDPDSFHVLAKNMFRYEQTRGLRSGHSAMEDWQSGKLRQKQAGPDANRKGYKGAYKDIEKKKWTVQDKNLDASLQKIYRMTDGKLSYANILAMGQIQQLADMYTVANEMIYPSLSQTMLAAQQNVLATGYAGSNAGSAAGGAQTAGNNAAIIAGLLGEKFKQDVAGIEYENDYLADPNAPKSGPLGFLGIGGTMSKEEFTQGMNNLGDHRFDKYRYNAALTEVETGNRLNHPDWSADQIRSHSETQLSSLMNPDGSIKEGKYKNWSVAQDTLLRPVTDYVEKVVPSVYDQSQMGEYGGGNSSGGGGGGGGSGDGSGSSKDNTGTRKERVDLVLCNKKEIPKLNVNLFKKPPNFTILNKNFKLRDIKINSQDKPKAIMNAVKNGIIETQKRMDPKIIQDETADYDPLESTDGKSVPSGTTKTTT